MKLESKRFIVPENGEDTGNRLLITLLVRGKREELGISESTRVFLGTSDQFNSANDEVQASGGTIPLAFVHAESKNAGPNKTMAKVIELRDAHPETTFAVLGDLVDATDAQRQLEESGIAHINPGVKIREQIEELLGGVFGERKE